MRPPNPNPTHTSLGMANEREDLLGQEARNSRVTRWGRVIARATLVCAVAIFAVLLFGPASGAIGWIGTYLLPVVVVGVVIFGVFGVAAYGLATLYDKYRQHW